MGILRKEEMLYANENGKLVSQEVGLWGDEENTKVKMKPLMPEEIQEVLEAINDNGRVFAKINEKKMEIESCVEEVRKKELQTELDVLENVRIEKTRNVEDKNISLLINHISEPVLTKEDMKFIKPIMKEKLTKTMFLLSGIPENALVFGFSRDGKSMVK